MTASKSQKARRERPLPRLIIHGPKVTHLSRSLGAGLISEYAEIEIGTGKLWRYSIAYVNPMIFAGDNGRVLGYDNAHGYPHRHFKGEITGEPALSWNQISEKFDREWREIAKQFLNESM